MDRNEKIAGAFGWEKHKVLNPYCEDEFEWLLPTPPDPPDSKMNHYVWMCGEDLPNWREPKWAQKIRDRVRELCTEDPNINSIGYEWNKAGYINPSPSHSVMLYHADGYRSKAQYTEAAAWEEALIWLNEDRESQDSHGSEDINRR